MARKNPKDRLRIKEIYYYDIDFEGKVTELINRLQHLIVNYGDEVEIGIEVGWYDDPDEYHLIAYRDETDTEYNARQKKLEKARERNKASAAKKAIKEAEKKLKEEERERELYEELKKKYGSQK